MAATITNRRQWVSREEVLDVLRSNKVDPELEQEITELEGIVDSLYDPWDLQAEDFREPRT